MVASTRGRAAGYMDCARTTLAVPDKHVMDLNQCESSRSDISRLLSLEAGDPGKLLSFPQHLCSARLYLNLAQEISLKKILAIALVFTAATAAASEIDKRQTLSFNEIQRDYVLTEMRALLSGTQNILDALLSEDMAAVARHARSLGMGMTHKAEGHLKAILPKEFMQLGMSVHKDFDQIANDAESLKDPKHTLRQLSESMKKCNTCHEAYQIRVTARPSNHQHQH